MSRPTSSSRASTRNSPRKFSSEEERNHGDGDPADDPENSAELDKKEIAITTVEEAVKVAAVGDRSAVRVGEESDGKAAPCSVSEVDRGGIDGIIDLHLEEKSRETAVDDASDQADNEGSPGGENGGTGSDGDKTRKAAVHGVGQIVLSLTSLEVAKSSVGHQGRDGTGGGSQGGSDGTESSNVIVASGGDVER